MAKVEDRGQAGFEDKPLPVPEDVIEAIDTYLEHEEAAATFRRAKAKIKEAIPQVEGGTRFCIAERYFVTANPYSAKAHKVGGGRRQRLKIEGP